MDKAGLPARGHASHLDVDALWHWAIGLDKPGTGAALAALGVTLAAGRRGFAPGPAWFAAPTLPDLDEGDSIAWTLDPVLERDGSLNVEAIAPYQAALLAAAWTAATPQPAWEDQHLPSLALDTGSLDIDSAVWLSARLRREWIGRGSFVAAADLGSGPAFRWPLRVGLLADPASQALREKLEGIAAHEALWLGNIVEFVAPQGPDTPIEILLTPRSLDVVMAVADAERHGFEAACVVALDGLGTLGKLTADGLRQALLGSIDPSAVAVATVPPDQRARWFVDMAETFSHDQTLDVAIQTATSRLGHDDAGLVVGDPAALVAMRVQSAAMRAIDALPVAGPDMVFLPLETAQQLNLGGIDVGGDRVELARDVITQEFLRPQLYDHETHGATSVSTLGRLIEAEWDQPQAAMAEPPEFIEEVAANVDVDEAAVDVADLDLEAEAGGPIGDEGGDMAAAVEPPEPAAHRPVRPGPRFIRARVWERGQGKRIERRGRLKPGTRHDIDVSIGPKTKKALSGKVPVDLSELDRDHGRHRLQIAFDLDDGRPPQVHRVMLPERGASTTCRFRLDTPTSGAIRARIIVLYRNRVLQTALLTGAVARTRGLGRSPLRMTTETIVRPTFGNLSHRTPFELAIVHNHGDDGKPGVTAIHGSVPIRVPTADLDKDVAAIHAKLTAAAEDPTKFAGLEKPGTIDLLFVLARRGVGLRRLIVDEDDSKGLGDPLRTPRIQVVAAKAGTLFPIEFFYDFPPPIAKVLCKNAETALREGHCDPANHGPVVNGAIGVVCPVGFWSMNRVIERHAPPIETGGDLEEAATADHADPVRPGARLAPLSTAMFASSDRVKKKDATNVLAALTAATAGHVTNVDTWAAWASGITDTGPDLLMLLSHSDKDKDTDEAELVIAANDALASGLFNRSYVRLKPPKDSHRRPGPGPVVFLLGCDTATPWAEYQDFVGIFTFYGAEIVVGTVATVAASHAANVASRLVAELTVRAPAPVAAGAPGKRPSKAQPFGDVLLTARRNLLADGEVMALALTGFGDSDWALG